jgi:pimeloyl-ACP methyl ester carboxylesterase
MKNLPLILIHGYPFDHTLWYSVIASLGSTAKVFAPDLPGFGRSGPPPEQAPSLEVYAEYLLHYLDRNGFEKVILGGMSMGGYIAAAFAERFSERLGGLALISSQAAADSEESRQNRFKLIEKIRKDGVAVAVAAILPKMFAPSRPISDDFRAFVAEGAEKAGVEGLCWALEAMAGRPDRTAAVTQLDIPTLIAHGREDAIIPMARARDLAEQCRHPYFAELRLAGHATPLEAPDELAQGLARLVKNVQESQRQEAAAA